MVVIRHAITMPMIPIEPRYSAVCLCYPTNPQNEYGHIPNKERSVDNRCIEGRKESVEGYILGGGLVR
jgi:hypothetical protein